MTGRPDSFMPLYVGDYLRDTLRLTRDQHGGYILLIMAYWADGGPLADDDESLAAITKAGASDWKKLRPVLAPFFDIGGGIWRHKRIDQEMVRAQEVYSKRSEAGKLGAEKKWQGHDKANGKRNGKRIAPPPKRDSWGIVGANGPPNDKATGNANAEAYGKTIATTTTLSAPSEQERVARASARGTAPPAATGNLPGTSEKWLKLAEKLGAEQFRVWFGDCQTNGSETSIYAPSPFQKEQIEHRFEGDFEEIFGCSVRVHFDAKVWNPLAIAKAGVSPTTPPEAAA